jgi:2-polyprenyl-6-methoxyphenol hydroxylase-like FAD-dependent oxidoreductase
MQFHHQGFRAGDPGLADPDPKLSSRRPADGSLPATADVLIVGCGPAGLTLAAQLAAFSEIHVVIVDQKLGPLQVGQADGVACRTMEMFEAFGFAHRVLQEAYFVNETTFWKPDPSNSNHIARSGRVPDVEEGLSHMPHVILNQARVHDFYLELMARSASRLVPHYGRKLLHLQRDTHETDFPVLAEFELHSDAQSNGQQGKKESIRAKYVVGCDGARSSVRSSIGRSLQGDSANQAWGVMDILAVTDFPDIRFKTLIQSSSEGSMVIIPREGGYMVRLYVELDKLKADERVSARNITREQLIAAAQRILRPHTLDVKEVAWWSVYEIGQRLCDKFDDVAAQEVASKSPRIFIAGDACHTHSPKAGQGMNVSMQDAFNLGWKLAGVLRGQYAPEFLHTYSSERQAIAKQLIDFDREWAQLLSKPVRKAGDPPGLGIEATEVQRYFVQHGRYTAGTATHYASSKLTAQPKHQALASGLTIGKRFHSAPVMRIGDGKLMQLGETLAADGRWRLMLFAGTSSTSLNALCDGLMNFETSPIRRFTPPGADIDFVIDVRAVFQASHHDLAITALPELLFPHKAKLGLRDYEKAFCAVPGNLQNIYTLRGINREQGCIVIVRPDQYVAQVLPLNGMDELAAFFNQFMRQ